jgi:hypothetical protein
MALRDIGGAAGELLQYTFNVAAAWQATVAVGDNCALDTTANLTIKDTVDNNVILGRVVALSPDSTLATVEIYGYTAVREFTTDAALAVGADINTKGAGSNIVEDATVACNTLVIYDPGGAGTALVLV